MISEHTGRIEVPTVSLEWRYLSTISGNNITIPTGYNEYMFQIEFSVSGESNPRTFIILPNNVATANYGSRIYVTSWWTSNTNFGYVTMAKNNRNFRVDTGVYAININGSWVNGNIRLYVR